jgi:hypothetical protein
MFGFMFQVALIVTELKVNIRFTALINRLFKTL